MKSYHNFLCAANKLILRHFVQFKRSYNTALNMNEALSNTTVVVLISKSTN